MERHHAPHLSALHPLACSQVAQQAAQKAALVAVSLILRGYGHLLFGWGRWWLRVPLFVAAFAGYVGQQLPPSPEGVFDIRVKPGWRDAAPSRSDAHLAPDSAPRGPHAAPPVRHTHTHTHTHTQTGRRLAHRCGHQGDLCTRRAACHLPAA